MSHPIFCLYYCFVISVICSFLFSKPFYTSPGSELILEFTFPQQFTSAKMKEMSNLRYKVSELFKKKKSVVPCEGLASHTGCILTLWPAFLELTADHNPDQEKPLTDEDDDE